MLFSLRTPLWIIASSLCIAAVAGCSNNGADQPETGKVSGVVTLDGTPVAKALVSFQPPQGRPSSGMTDDKGHYVLIYNAHTLGAKVGQHKVFISTIGGMESSEGGKEAMPPSVADGSTLTADVTGSSNVINFKLESSKYPSVSAIKKPASPK